jgi:proline racemase
MHTGGYEIICGHETVGAVTSMIEGDLLNRDISWTAKVVLETPAGFISALPVMKVPFSPKGMTKN